jgi:hypothetical protein
LTASDRAWQACGHDCGWGKAIVADHSACLTNDDDCRKTLFLVRERSRLEPPVERWFAAGELVEKMGRRERFRAGDRQASASLVRAAFLL